MEVSLLISKTTEKFWVYNFWKLKKKRRETKLKQGAKKRKTMKGESTHTWKGDEKQKWTQKGKHQRTIGPRDRDSSWKTNHKAKELPSKYKRRVRRESFHQAYPQSLPCGSMSFWHLYNQNQILDELPRVPNKISKIQLVKANTNIWLSSSRSEAAIQSTDGFNEHAIHACRRAWREMKHSNILGSELGAKLKQKRAWPN